MLEVRIGGFQKEETKSWIILVGGEPRFKDCTLYKQSGLIDFNQCSITQLIIKVAAYMRWFYCFKLNIFWFWTVDQTKKSNLKTHTKTKHKQMKRNICTNLTRVQHNSMCYKGRHYNQVHKCCSLHKKRKKKKEPHYMLLWLWLNNSMVCWHYTCYAVDV